MEIIFPSCFVNASLFSTVLLRIWTTNLDGGRRCSFYKLVDFWILVCVPTLHIEPIFLWESSGSESHSRSPLRWAEDCITSQFLHLASPRTSTQSVYAIHTNNHLMHYPTRQRASIPPNSASSSTTPSAPVRQLPEHPACKSHSLELLVSAATLHHWKHFFSTDLNPTPPFQERLRSFISFECSSAPAFISMMHLSGKTNDPRVHTASAPQAPLQQTPLISLQSAAPHCPLTELHTLPN